MADLRVVIDSVRQGKPATGLGSSPVADEYGRTVEGDSGDMPTEAHPVSAALPERARPRRALVIIARSLLVSAAVVAGYFVLPFNSLAADTLWELVAGLVVITGLLAWQIRGILRSPLPGVQAVATLAISMPLFVVVFAAAYFLMGQADASQFTQPLTRFDALYFSVTTFTTVGFGDITAVTEAARAVVTAEMVLTMVLVGVIIRLIMGAVQVARARQPSGHEE
jgi:hypothetical protein